MADNHRNKRLRRLSTEEDTSASESWTAVRSNTNQNGASTTNTGRPRRAAAMASTSVTVERASPEERTSIRLTVKAPPNKLRQATQGRPTRNAGTRAAARRRPIVEESTSSDEEEDEDVEDDQLDDDEEDAAGEDDDEEMVDVEEEDDDEDEEDDAEGEDDDEMADYPPVPIQASQPIPVAPKITKTAPPAVKSKQIQPESDDEELSSLGSLDDDDELGEEDENEGGEEDIEGAAGLEDDLGGSDDDSELGSREETPDLTKLTRRQRADYDPSEMMALSNEAQKKKHLTAEEHAMRRAEMARRRKNLSEKRNEEEKMSTIDRLLNKQEPKRRRKNAAADPFEGIDEEGFEGPKAPAGFVRYIQTVEGSRLLVPQEWVDAPAGEVYSGQIVRPLRNVPPFSGKLIEEIV